MKNALSVIVIARNEEDSLPDCLSSVKSIADEIILVDSGSTDNTIKIAKTFGVKIFQHDWPGYSAQKQFALNKAEGPWVLNIDADERVSPELANEILKVLEDDATPINGYDIPFHHFFGKTRLRFGGVQRETHLRLFRKEKSRYGIQTIHEGINVESPTGTLNGHIDHFSYKDIHDYLTKCNHYTSLISRDKYEKGARFRPWHHLRLPWEFFIRYFLKLGFLDGGLGLRYALLSSYYVWLKYAKLKDFEEAST